VAAYIGEVWMGGFLAGWICPDTSGEWRVVPMPMWVEGGLRSSDSCGSSWFITKDTKNPEAAWAVAEFYALNEDAVLKQYEALDQFPTYEKTYSDPFFYEPIAFFGGQPVRSVFASLVQSIPDQNINFSKNFELYRTNITVMMQKVLLNNIPADRAVRETEANILSQM
jgi:ABC-type glycerol-3-phosphate transport system substrate-binding protein